jgi:putative spermidine/putrescine transport system substrate-binding protein
MDTVVITEGTPNRELALAWVQVVLSPSTQLAYAERLYFGPTNSTVGVSAELAERVVYGQEAVEALVSLDWGYVAESRSGLTERWNKEILGG